MAEQVPWHLIAAKLAYLVVKDRTPGLSEQDAVSQGATLLSHAINHEMTVVGESESTVFERDSVGLSPIKWLRWWWKVRPLRVSVWEAANEYRWERSRMILLRERGLSETEVKDARVP
jgi:hypothetical protein